MAYNEKIAARVREIIAEIESNIEEKKYLAYSVLRVL